MRIMSIVSALSLATVAAAVSAAEQRGTPPEAKAMLQQALAHYKTVGRTQALADFNAKKPPFGRGDLYVACIGPDHKLTANGGFPQFVGQSADLLKDSSGKSIGQAGWDAATKQGQAEVRYQWFNPASQRIEPKITYFAKAGEDVCGVGAYNP
jgi:cytochrome c